MIVTTALRATASTSRRDSPDLDGERGFPPSPAAFCFCRRFLNPFFLCAGSPCRAGSSLVRCAGLHRLASSRSTGSTACGLRSCVFLGLGSVRLGRWGARASFTPPWGGPSGIRDRPVSPALAGGLVATEPSGKPFYYQVGSPEENQGRFLRMKPGCPVVRHKGLAGAE